MNEVSFKREVFNCVVDRNRNYKQVQAPVIKMADRAKVDLFITFHCRSSPIVLLNLRARTWRFGTCNLAPESAHRTGTRRRQRNIIIQKNIVKTCSYSSPQLNFAIYEGLAQQGGWYFRESAVLFLRDA